MWYTDNEKLDIGRRVYTHEISKEQACKEYDISIITVVNYVKLYLKAHNIPAIPEVMNTKGVEIPNYQEMTKNELITELMKKDIEIARTKKGYNVKGGGKEKEYVILSDQNSK